MTWSLEHYQRNFPVMILKKDHVMLFPQSLTIAEEKREMTGQYPMIHHWDGPRYRLSKLPKKPQKKLWPKGKNNNSRRQRLKRNKNRKNKGKKYQTSNGKRHIILNQPSRNKHGKVIIIYHTILVEIRFRIT